jgi:hypothetical protein
VRELTERRTPSVRVFQMSDGQVEAEVSPRPTAFKDTQGRLPSISGRGNTYGKGIGGG